MQLQCGSKGRARSFRTLHLFQNRAQPGQRAEMKRIARQSLFDIGHGRAQTVGHEPCCGAGVPGLGEIRRVVDDSAEMGDSRLGFAVAQRLLPALKQIICDSRSRTAPLALNLTLDSLPALLIRARQFAHQPVQIGCGHVLRPRTFHQRQECDSCRHDKIEKSAPVLHNHKIAYAPEIARGRAAAKPGNAITSRTDSTMSEVIQQGVEALNEKLGGEGFDGLAKFVIEEEGEIVLDSEGARAGDDDADVTLTASAETFRGMMEGNVNPTMAFMSGQLKIDGDMSLAMKLAAVLS